MKDSSPVPVTGVVLTMNSERTLDAALQSLDFCSELLVIDSGSSDSTLEIARRRGARILERPWEGIQSQFRFALQHVNTPWAVSLDSDEEFTPECKQAVMAALAKPGNAAGFSCNRLSWYFDRFIKHSGWHPDWLVRVFRMDAVQLRGQDPHHEFAVNGPAPRLGGCILHYPYENLSAHVERINRYTQTMAQGIYAKGGRAGVAKALSRGLARFLKIYVLRQGFLDGRAGLVLAVHGFFYAFHKYLRVAELEKLEKRER